MNQVYHGPGAFWCAELHYFYKSRKFPREAESPGGNAPGPKAALLQCQATGSTLPVAWMSVMSFLGHFSTQIPQEVHLV